MTLTLRLGLWGGHGHPSTGALPSGHGHPSTGALPSGHGHPSTGALPSGRSRHGNDGAVLADPRQAHLITWLWRIPEVGDTQGAPVPAGAHVTYIYIYMYIRNARSMRARMPRR